MALFSRDRGRSRGGVAWGSKNIRGSFRGQKPGRGRGNHSANAGNKSTFYSTRVEEQPEDFPEDDRASLDPESDDNPQDFSEASSDSEDIKLNEAQPYITLLQSLNPSSERGEPQRKKIKSREHGPAEEQQEIRKEDPDRVDGPEDAEDLDADDADIHDPEQGGDPFLKHLDPKDEDLDFKIKAVKQNQWSVQKPSLQSEWSLVFRAPDIPLSIRPPESSISPSAVSNVESLHLKQRLQGPAKKNIPSFNSVTGNLAPSMFNYHDILFPQRTIENGANLRKLTCLHALNHVFKTRDRVIKDNARLAKDDTEEDLELRDQGFTRPKVLILLPTRSACCEYVETIISLCEPEQQENRKRFQESYAMGEPTSADKPEDFRDLFNGNDDDMFRLGLKFTRKTIKFFAQFYNSDIIFASPLGLRMALGADDPKKQDADFLSSIEVLVIDKAESMLMQNWEHIEYIFDRLNLQPKEAHACDFSRVRNWYLDGNAKYLRQTILFSAFNFPSLNKLYTHHLLNVAGNLKYSIKSEGSMTNLSVSLKQTFSRFDFGTPVAEPDNRFKYFTTAIVPSLTRNNRQSAAGNQGVLIYLPSYADFVRVRNYLATSSATQDISFGSISEYTSTKDVARARSHFFSGRHSVLLYTERAHHFRRYHLKGVGRVVMYGLPENPVFYSEVVEGFLGASIAAAKLDAREASVRVLFSRLDILKLERVVGTKRYLLMLTEKGGDTFDFA